MHINKIVLSVAALAGLLLAMPANAGVTFKDGDKYVKLGGRVQLQYNQADPTGGDTTDTLFFRRLRTYVEGSIHPDWKGKIQFDIGKSSNDNELVVKDAYMTYTGFEKMNIMVGSSKTPFSREFLTSSKKQQLVERTFVGDHNYGAPDRMLGVFLTGKNGSKKLTWSTAFGMENLDPDVNKIDFDNPANNNSDWNQGRIAAGRVDFHPFGILKMSQGDFKREQKATIGIGAFSWSNDGDNNTYTSNGISTSTSKADVDSANGIELSGAYRNAGFSVDLQFNTIKAKTVDPMLTAGVYQGGETTLSSWSVKGGYMLIPGKFEIVAGLESQDADGYAAAWDRTSVGANWFLARHDIKVQFTYRLADNLKGQRGNDEDELFVQMQYVF